MPTCCPYKIGPTLPAPWCCRRAAPPGRLRRAARGAAGPCCRRAACRSTPGRLPHAPGPSLGKHCRPRGAAGQDRPHAPGRLPTCYAPGRLPTCCPWCCRPVLRRAALPDRCHVPAGCRCAASQDRLPARGAADVLRLPAGCPTLPARHSGSIAGPVVLPLKIGPRSRPVADVLPVKIGCRHAARGAALPVNSSICGADYSAQKWRAEYDRHMPRCPTFLTPSTGISPSDSVTPICFTLEEV